MDFVSQLNDSLSGLTTSQVAALIAFGTFASQLLLSFIWPLILVGYISESESAVTWSVASRVIHNSFWPAVLRTDATATSGVRRRVSVVSYGVIFGSVLVAVAGVITPLGLYDSILPSGEGTAVRFEYIPDTTALGLGTAPRHDTLGFSRQCFNNTGTRWLSPDPCPHSNVELDVVSADENETMIYAPEGYDTRIPENVYGFFQSGVPRLGQTVSSLFDIEYRNYRLTKDSIDEFFQNGSDYLAGDYRQITNMALNDELDVVEGLVVDTKNGGVGFRNHTAPAKQFELGAQWSEDILFIEPVTECASLNITLEFKIPDQTELPSLANGRVVNLTLVDRGGFVDFDPAVPLYEGSDQEDPELSMRAYRGAWKSNVNMMYLFNISKPDDFVDDRVVLPYLDSEHGKAIPLPAMNTSGWSDYNAESISIDGGTSAWSFLGLDATTSFNNSEGRIAPSNGSSFDLDDFTIHKPVNPWGLSRENFTEIVDVCRGALGDDTANITSVSGQCGLARGMPQRSDGSDSVRLEQGSEWTLPLYYCASASRAVLKTVSFSVDNTTNIDGIHVTGVAEKEYRDASEYPIWAAEDTGRALAAVKPLWGLAESEDASPLGDVSFKRHPYLWLTGYETYAADKAKRDEIQNLAGLQFHSMALGVAYTVGGLVDDQYSGAGSLPMYNRWKELTKSPEGTAKVVSLIWTDVSANAVVGTRGQMPERRPPGLGPAFKGGSGDGKSKRAETDGRDGDEALVDVQVLQRKVRYKLPYAVPAFITLALLLSTLGFAVAALITRHATPGRVRWFLTRLSAGRVMTATLVGGIGDAPGPAGAGGDKWVEGPGRVTVGISGTRPTVVGESAKAGDSEGGEKTQVAPGTGMSPSSSMLEGRNGGAP